MILAFGWRKAGILNFRVFCGCRKAGILNFRLLFCRKNSTIKDLGHEKLICAQTPKRMVFRSRHWHIRAADC